MEESLKTFLNMMVPGWNIVYAIRKAREVEQRRIAEEEASERETLGYKLRAISAADQRDVANSHGDHETAEQYDRRIARIASSMIGKR